MLRIAGRTLHRVRDADDNAGGLVIVGGPAAPGRTFAKERCFQIIYFISNISFVFLRGTAPRPRVETGWLTHAVKNAWADWRQTRLLQGFN
jgi:hypothetical protein